MLIIAIILIPLAFIAGVFCCLKAVRMGLQWQYDIKHEQEPKKETNPITEAVQVKQQQKQVNLTQEMMKEWSPFIEEVSEKR